MISQMVFELSCMASPAITHVSQVSFVAFMVATLFIKPRMNDTTFEGGALYLQLLFFSIYFMYACLSRSCLQGALDVQVDGSLQAMTSLNLQGRHQVRRSHLLLLIMVSQLVYLNICYCFLQWSAS